MRILAYGGYLEKQSLEGMLAISRKAVARDGKSNGESRSIMPMLFYQRGNNSSRVELTAALKPLIRMVNNLWQRHADRARSTRREAIKYRSLARLIAELSASGRERHLVTSWRLKLSWYVVITT